MAADNDNSASKLQKIRTITSMYIDSLIAQGLIEETVLDDVMDDLALSKGYALGIGQIRGMIGFRFIKL